MIAAPAHAAAPNTAIRTEVPGRYCTTPHNGRFRSGRDTGARGRGTIGPWLRRTRPIILSAMLSFVRALGFLAPLAVAASVAVALGVVTYLPESQRPTLVIVLGGAALAGMTTMALVAWSYFGWRLTRIASSLERTIEADRPVRAGSPPSGAWRAPSMRRAVASCRPRRARRTIG